jgi:hypothetical protein
MNKQGREQSFLKALEAFDGHTDEGLVLVTRGAEMEVRGIKLNVARTVPGVLGCSAPFEKSHSLRIRELSPAIGHD